jgi:uncharacterized Fe-S cluster protein YjdI
VTKRTYGNKSIRVFWDSDRCIHSQNCVVGLPAVFDNERTPWIDVDAAGADEIRRVVATCPSGALTCETPGSVRGATGDHLPSIRALRDGPYQVRGKVRLVGPDGTEIGTGEICLLCGCGGSRKKPFCDGTHKHHPSSHVD